MDDYDAFCLLSYGGPEKTEEIEPFLDSVLSGKRVPLERRALVGERYRQQNGCSPLPGQCRQYLSRLKAELERVGKHDISLFWGNLHASPFMDEAVQQIIDKKVKRLLLFSSAPFDIPQSGVRYESAFRNALKNNINTSHHDLPCLDFYEPFYLHPRYLRAAADSLLSVLAESDLNHCSWNDDDNSDINTDVTTNANITKENDTRLLLFSFHSIPEKDAIASQYLRQATEHVEHLIRQISLTSPWQIVFQSRSGRPEDPWIGPSIEETIQKYKREKAGLKEIIVIPSGFFFENMETVYDLDREVGRLCQTLNLTFRRASCAGLFEGALDLVLDRLLVRTGPKESQNQN